MSYNSHIKAINDRLDKLISYEFKELIVKNQRMFKDENLGRRHEYIRYIYKSDEYAGCNTDGEDRTFNYDMSFYFHDLNTDDSLDYHIYYQIDRLNWVICNEQSQYDADGNYVWHNARIISREIVEREEDDNIIEVRMELELTRKCTWATTANYATGIYDITDYGYSKYA